MKKKTTPHDYRRQSIHTLILALMLVIIWSAFGCSPRNGCRATRSMSGYSYFESLNKIRMDNIVRQVLINGHKVLYDAVSSCSLDSSLSYYPPSNWVYIGSSDTSYINGVENIWPHKEHYFYQKKSTYRQYKPMQCLENNQNKITEEL